MANVNDEGVLKSMADEERESRAAGNPPRFELMEDGVDNPELAEELNIWEQSRAATDFIAGQVQMARVLPLDMLIEACNKADSVGSIFDPTGYRRHGRSITAARRIFQATKKWIREVEEATREASR